MELESKYSIGDKVWMITDNKIDTFEIQGVMINVTSPENVNITYQFGDSVFGYPENKLFPSKEELLKSL